MANNKSESPQADKSRELECDPDEAVFEDKVRQVATSPKPERESEK
ncbi:hypothetical protein [Brevundimonas vesicularis]